ncbi:hypothetical protein R1sor_027061 [Riccia sorocarpa]|uniref:Uncharacterized protein n=1 Tax=Riccia sorocarpa TaxID=122646 RepID=A0ABD3GD50_9MARC
MGWIQKFRVCAPMKLLKEFDPQGFLEVAFSKFWRSAQQQVAESIPLDAVTDHPGREMTKERPAKMVFCQLEMGIREFTMDGVIVTSRRSGTMEGKSSCKHEVTKEGKVRILEKFFPVKKPTPSKTSALASSKFSRSSPQHGAESAALDAATEHPGREMTKEQPAKMVFCQQEMGDPRVHKFSIPRLLTFVGTMGVKSSCKHEVAKEGKVRILEKLFPVRKPPPSKTSVNASSKFSRSSPQHGAESAALDAIQCLRRDTTEEQPAKVFYQQERLEHPKVHKLDRPRLLGKVAFIKRTPRVYSERYGFNGNVGATTTSRRSGTKESKSSFQRMVAYVGKVQILVPDIFPKKRRPIAKYTAAVESCAHARTGVSDPVSKPGAGLPDSRSGSFKSVRAPDPRPLHLDPPYSHGHSALSLSLNANMFGGIPPVGRGGATQVTASFDTEDVTASFEAHSMAYQFSNSAGVSNHISSVSREDKAAKVLKANLQQTAMMVESPKETVVDPGLLSVDLLSSPVGETDSFLVVWFSGRMSCQRIALNWMEEREAKMGLPYGGILADDQGLGKTISTIALILKARAPIRRKAVETSDSSPFETATIDLGDDDDSHLVGVNISAGGKSNTKGQATEGLKRAVNRMAEDVEIGFKGRPAAGTLVVCPTSVLRQWGSELEEKVTEAANLSVLIYHGSSRTKDPEELAKYDVVLTTYSIVSIEVPKQPLPEEQDADKKNPNDLDFPPPFRPSKPKKPDKTGAKKTRGDGKGRFVEWEDGSFDSGPLARVNWFRVILDEAQSIKDSRTQVARAAWGLRAKRRWCLSGTPIQNSIDDLYSYFRFLRYTPYDGFRTFREKIKDPEKGYKALQGLLSAVMLRRTKDTLMDGKPIVNLPQRIVTLKQTEFSEDERMFYTNLETESRKQFQDYADAGTVQSNYMNILWMLLRLRQACDHPLLVKGHEAQSAQKIVKDSARALPPELQIQLLHLLETIRDICPLCNDPPDDAVVSICTHIFCRQCISEQLATGYDSCCTVPKCKKQLNLSLIFTLACLRSCDGDAGNSTSVAPIADGTSENGRSPEETEWKPSSKIDAVIGTLNALPKITVLVENGTVIAEISDREQGSNYCKYAGS